MINDIFILLKEYAAVWSALIAFASLVVSITTRFKMNKSRRVQTTIECFNIIQEQVFDKLEEILDKNNAAYIVESMEEGNADSELAYKDYLVLIARPEHFSVGVNKKIYDFDTVDSLAGLYLIDLYKRIKPIIEKENENYLQIEYYGKFVEMIHRLEMKHPNSSAYFNYEEVNYEKSY